MKKVFFILLVLGMSRNTNAQLQGGIKAGVNYNSGIFSNVLNDVLSGAESKTGYHMGLWLRAKLPAIGFYIRPEIVYTELKNGVSYNNGQLQQKTNFKFQKIDAPILVGKKIFNIGNVFAGPSFQYILSSGFGLNDLSEVSTDELSLGVQFGFGIEFGRLGIDARWERSLSKINTFFFDNIINDEVVFNTRVNQIIFGISYRL